MTILEKVGVDRETFLKISGLKEDMLLKAHQMAQASMKTKNPGIKQHIYSKIDELGKQMTRGDFDNPAKALPPMK